MSIRDRKVTTNLTAEMLDQLDEFAAANHWTRSTAIATLVEWGLERIVELPPVMSPEQKQAAERFLGGPGPA